MATFPRFSTPPTRRSCLGEFGRPGLPKSRERRTDGSVLLVVGARKYKRRSDGGTNQNRDTFRPPPENSAVLILPLENVREAAGRGFDARNHAGGPFRMH